MRMGELALKYGCSWSTISKLKNEFDCVGLRSPKDWRDKTSSSLKGRIIDKNWRKKISIGRKGIRLGVKFSPEHRKRISIARMGMKFSDEHRKNIGIASSKRVGWRWSEDMKRKLSLSAVKKHMAGNDRRKRSGFLYCGIIFIIREREDPLIRLGG
jgi:hypothetical protein